MTRSYRLDAPAHAIAAALGADAGGDVWQGGDVAFGTYAPVVIRVPDRGRMMTPRLWGVPPPPGREHPLATLRNLESPFWIGTLRHTQFRCLIPVTAYCGAGAGWYSVPSAPIFALAGIWRDSEIPSFAVVTTEPNALAEANRSSVMPVILHPQDYGLWLTGDWKKAQRLVSPFPSQLMHLKPI